MARSTAICRRARDARTMATTAPAPRPAPNRAAAASPPRCSAGWAAPCGADGRKTMHPALSVIFFTTLSGAGYGLLAWLGLSLFMLHTRADLMPMLQPLYLWGLLAGLALSAAGLLSSLAHLGRPARAWRALSQWRTSWLSREGVVETAPRSVPPACRSELARQGVSRPWDRYSYGRRLPGLQFNASPKITSPFNLPAPGRCQALYIIFRFRKAMCF